LSVFRRRASEWKVAREIADDFDDAEGGLKAIAENLEGSDGFLAALKRQGLPAALAEPGRITFRRLR
jgi:hypothetical protein